MCTDALSVCSCWFAFVESLFSSLAPLAFGQGGTGTITGTVTDPTGLAVAGANVQARNTETGVVYSAASTAVGKLYGPEFARWHL